MLQLCTFSYSLCEHFLLCSGKILVYIFSHHVPPSYSWGQSKECSLQADLDAMASQLPLCVVYVCEQALLYVSYVFFFFMKWNFIRVNQNGLTLTLHWLILGQLHQSSFYKLSFVIEGGTWSIIHQISLNIIRLYSSNFALPVHHLSLLHPIKEPKITDTDLKEKLTQWLQNCLTTSKKVVLTYEEIDRIILTLIPELRHYVM